MDFLDVPRSRQLFYLTACISLLAHLVVLLLPMPPAPASKPRQRLTVRMAPPIAMATPQRATNPQPAPAVTQSRLQSATAPRLLKSAPAQRQPVLTAPAPAPAPTVVDEPKYTQAERDDINNFLQSLGPKSKSRPDPRASLNERSQAMARDIGRELAQVGDDGSVSIERLPGSPPVDRFSLDFYLDSLVTKLNRNARIMTRPAGAGRQTAAVQLRINPDGTVKSLEVLDENDQKDEVDFIKRLLERSAPYSPFPPALTVSAKSLAITICIKPGRDGDSSFSRFERGEGRGC